MSERRNSIRECISLDGVGLHLGKPCRLTFRPAEAESGIAFRRLDLPGEPVTPALVEHAVLSERRTQLGTGEHALHTVEHVLAAVAAHEIDDVVIEMDGPEPPILDGSAGPFFDALSKVGLAPRRGVVRYLDIPERLTVTDGESVYEAEPATQLTLKVTIEFPHPLIGRQSCEFPITPETFARELAPARTFGFVKEVEALRSRGLIRGGSTESAIVLDDEGVVDNTLRWSDEFARHKTMDCVGDLALAGRRVRARVAALKPSHRGTITLVREMLTLAAKETRMLGIDEIMKIIPHRYPFLLVDRILEVDAGKRVVGIKNVTINEPFFQGHFPGHPIMPGVLIVEAMAQVGGLLLLGSVPDAESKIMYFTSLDNVKWRRPVKPGDQLRFELEMVQVRGRLCKMHGVARVDGDIACEADMGAMVMDL
ncbi:MAG TPA: bifunctional UDP-3-O-[3-hydroxymyristoyl] N-acetylglucosamine deacetylase/3-hydroxyacyl-ACP dehydratase [Gemmatimonadaceae bacterium]|nr:bifunctional UDP-3-O-[3-hydroxymyristoyl] N-acetylglucosamine deacetylase/3-hydroxyacyl-ACP dehydratase [Gemmatimonadaceae bacterium]